MKNCYLIFLIFTATLLTAQEGQSFCDGNATASYFPLTIQKKVILWGNTSYIETLVGEKVLNGKTYKEYEQKWENGEIQKLYLRVQSGTVFEYFPSINKEKIRMKEHFHSGESWSGPDKSVRYTFLSDDEKLVTKYCQYNKLLKIEAEYETVTYMFYYLRGYGYIGATENGRLISCVSPEW